jgi:hypothetical protein
MRLNWARSLLWERWLGKELSKQMLTVSVDVLVRNVMDDFTGDVDKRDVVCLGDVKDGVAGAIGKSSHTDVQAVVAAFNVIDGELGEQVGDVWRCQQGQMDLLGRCLRLLLPEKSDNLEPELSDGDEAKRSALMILLYFGRDDAERCLDQSWEIFQTKRTGVGLESLVVFEVLRLVVYQSTSAVSRLGEVVQVLAEEWAKEQ